jgi:hypothetical protein
MNTRTGMNPMALGCIVLGLAGAVFALGGNGNANAMAQPQQVTKSSDMCAVAASFAVTDPAVAKQMGRAIGCRTSHNGH